MLQTNVYDSTSSCSCYYKLYKGSLLCYKKHNMFMPNRILTIGALFATALGNASALESFDNAPGGKLESLQSSDFTLKADNSAEISNTRAKSGTQALRILGGEKKQVVLTLKQPSVAGSRFQAWAERWSGRAPFEFRIFAKVGDQPAKEIYNGDKSIKTGGLNTNIVTDLPTGTTEVIIECTTDDKSGVLLDDLAVSKPVPMQVKGEPTVEQKVMPSMIRKPFNPVVNLKLETSGQLDPAKLDAVTINLDGTTKLDDIEEVSIVTADKADGKPTGTFGSPQKPAQKLTFTGNSPLKEGANNYWVSVKLKNTASLDNYIDAGFDSIKINGKDIAINNGSPEGKQRIGYGVRLHGDSGSKFYRIPGLARSKKGTLLGVYDVRYRHSGDLPADVDVGLSRSTDKGQSWEDMRIAMDMGNDPKFGYDGIGDPCIWVDETTGRIWVAALWSHGNNAWNGSKPGMKPEETGQLVLVYSDDDGINWSKPINITEQVKDPAWHLILAGPGTGITMADGTMVFPAQYRSSKEENAKPYSTLIYSKDQGKSWKIGKGVKIDTTEAQLVETKPGTLMITCRDNRNRSRTVATTTDLGNTWVQHATSNKALPEPVCQASLMKVKHPKHGDVLLFSNPATTHMRYNMTVKASTDLGESWPDDLHTLYDSRYCAGYSCLAPIDDEYFGFYYEGPSEIYFLRLRYDEVLKTKK